MTRTADHRSQPLITLTGSPAESVCLTDMEGRLEPAFLIAYRGRLHIDASGWREKAKAAYAHAIANTPTALWLHVQRIGLLAETADPDILGAIVDLFLVLDDKGTALRKRMLALAKPLLEPEDYAILDSHPKRRSPGASLPPLHAKTSMLSPGITGHARLVTIEETASGGDEDPLETARQQIAYGQTDQALQTLETAIMAEPQRAELHQALLEIYRHSRERDRILGMWQYLKGELNPAEDEWRHLLDQFSEERDLT
ncbi:MAG: hypothetical protein KZQ95_08045 [Candidatus Thiodiazotropha sp. (ex Epidulcina cf. delphinae)]|nr:hypothetical protein [Candidatus Thiodiazotropha sp. (ex Epidulcina cf. delphinae)]